MVNGYNINFVLTPTLLSFKIYSSHLARSRGWQSQIQIYYTYMYIPEQKFIDVFR